MDHSIQIPQPPAITAIIRFADLIIPPFALLLITIIAHHHLHPRLMLSSEGILAVELVHFLQQIWILAPICHD